MLDASSPAAVPWSVLLTSPMRTITTIDSRKLAAVTGGAGTNWTGAPAPERKSDQELFNQWTHSTTSPLPDARSTMGQYPYGSK